MSRYTDGKNIAAAVCDAVVNKEATYRDPIKENSASAEVAASRFSNEGELAETLLSMVQYIDDESVLSQEHVHTFLQKSRKQLKEIAELNVENSRNVDVFIDSVRALKQVEVASFDAERTDEEMGDPGERLEQIYAQKKSEQAEMKLDFGQEKHYRDVCENMGEKVGKTEDEEIEMIHNSASQRTNLKCPITGTLMENPVKNKVCSHLYSRAGIESMIKQRHRNRKNCNCPYAGCGNSDVTLDQLEDDLVTANLIKKERRRLDHEKEVRHSQADAVDDSDGE